MAIARGLIAAILISATVVVTLPARGRAESPIDREADAIVAEERPSPHTSVFVSDADGERIPAVPEPGRQIVATGSPIMMRDGPRTVPAMRVVTAAGEVWLILLEGPLAGEIAATRQGLTTEVRGVLTRAQTGSLAAALDITDWRAVE